MPNYIDTVYDKRKRPITDYPVKLSEYLIERFKIEKGAKVLDLGCGRGDFLLAFARSGMMTTGIDRDRSFHMPEEARFIKADIEKDRFPLEDESFDLVFSKSVLEHVHDPHNLMNECLRILKPGGRIILMTPDWVSQMKIFFHDHTHRQPYTKESMKDLLDMYGFSDVDSDRFYQLPVIWKYPWMRIVSTIIRMLVPVDLAKKSNIGFLRWSCELMVLGAGIKTEEGM